MRSEPVFTERIALSIKLQQSPLRPLTLRPTTFIGRGQVLCLFLTNCPFSPGVQRAGVGRGVGRGGEKGLPLCQ